MGKVFKERPLIVDLRQPPIMTKVHEQAALGITSKLDAEIRDVLDDLWGGGWTLGDVARRCVMQKCAGNPIETLCADGIPLIEIHPVQSSFNRLPNGNYQLRYSRNFKRLWPR